MTEKSLDVVSLGEMLIDFISNEGGIPLADVGSFSRAAGGGPANVAVGAARLGARTGFIGKVGRDAFGVHLASILEENGVDTRGLVQDDEANTTLAFVALTAEAKPEYVFFRHGTADTRLSPEDLPLDMLGETRILHFSSVSLTAEPARTATVEAVRLARKAGAFVSFDPNVRLSLWQDEGSAREVITKAVGQSQLVKLNEEELSFLTGCEEIEEGLTTLLQFGPRLAAVTRGAQGAVLARPGLTVNIPSMPVDVVDTTGAGDAFMAGLLASLAGVLRDTGDVADLPERTLREFGRRASIAAGLTCTHLGVIPALPRQGEVEKQFIFYQVRQRGN
ncbi:5-dehydro-2-deoxygluconokinase [Peptococcaceae bacterium CEB3]|nr:5-dehydro-2-deoxygluconokinase [Peptococcaceae bacterium CEB3]